jgi:EH domain-containing protein 1
MILSLLILYDLQTSSDFDAKPMVMLLGQYSTGKTTFIKHLLGCDYPGAHIGPEPTTDRFVVAMVCQCVLI